MRPERNNIAAPDLPEEIEWIGEAPRSMPVATAGGPVLVHFLDFAQLNSVRTLPYIREWARRYEPHGLTTIGVQAPRFPFGAERSAVTAGLERLGVEFPVAIDADRRLWHAYGCEGWPSLFLWKTGGSLGRSGSIGSGSACNASCSRSSAWIASSPARYSPSPKWNQVSAPPVFQRKRLGQPSQP